MAKKTFVILHKLKESQFMVEAAASSNSLDIEECDFNYLVLNKMFYWTFLAV